MTIYKKNIIRVFDFLFSFLGLIVLFPILILLFMIGFFESGSPLFRQKRIGYNQKIFILIKFRSMKKNSKSVASHLIDNSAITPYGYLLRKTKLDEMPQLFNVFLGDMSIVGPRPCLPNQKKLITERKKRGVFKVKPGITGLAQISNIDMKTPTLLAKKDLEMIEKMSILKYFNYIYLTFLLILKKKS